MTPGTELLVVHRRDARSMVHLPSCPSAQWTPRRGRWCWPRVTTTAAQAEADRLVACQRCLADHSGGYSGAIFHVNTSTSEGLTG